MKIVFCGPPHSGKSVFLANLINYLPANAFTILRACPDGEGVWSNNQNQNQVSAVRKKGKFTKIFIEDSCRAIDNQVNPIILVDVGGVMSPENEQVFRHCDSFVVLSSDEEKKKEWLEFGRKLGLECIGSIDSKLEGKEEIYQREPFLEGKIIGLERGEFLENSKIIEALASYIIKRSKYTEVEQSEEEITDEILIDDTKLAIELGYDKKLPIAGKQITKRINWPEEAVSKVYQNVLEKVKKRHTVKVNGARANFMVYTICKACKDAGVENILLYDVRRNCYVPIKDIPKKKRQKVAEGIKYNIIENKDSVFMDVDLDNNSLYNLVNYEHCILPKIDEKKDLYLTGQLPLWLLGSIGISYNSNRIFTFQPGKGFTCVKSNDEKDLGTIVDGITGINLEQYFTDKRKMHQNANTPTVIEKTSVLSKIKSFFDSIKHRSRKSPYLDESIVATKVVPAVSPSTSSDNIRRNSQQEVTYGNLQNSKTINQKSDNEEVSKD